MSHFVMQSTLLGAMPATHLHFYANPEIHHKQLNTKIFIVVDEISLSPTENCPQAVQNILKLFTDKACQALTRHFCTHKEVIP